VTTKPHQINLNFKALRAQHLTHSDHERNVQDQFVHMSNQELRAHCDANSLPFWVCALNVLGELNTGTMIRSAHLWGAERVVIFGRNKTDNRGQVGAAHYTPVQKVWGLDAQGDLVPSEFANFCTHHQVSPIFVEQGGVSVFEFDWQGHVHDLNAQGKKPMLVMGTEHSGIPDHILHLQDELQGTLVSIPHLPFLGYDDERARRHEREHSYSQCSPHGHRARRHCPGHS
jgi:tRNA G18 (ribose-2'-O)-methylase SpoU